MSITHERFSGRVQAYLAYRPRFPRGIVPFLREHGALPEDAVVADVGAGTGMLAEIFLEAGHRVMAVEPNGEMLEACRVLAAHEPALEVVEGTAEATALPDASVDLIAVGRAHALVRLAAAHIGSSRAFCGRMDGF